jgi:enoyl-CoA hydratase/carnithine racemase
VTLPDQPLAGARLRLGAAEGGVARVTLARAGRRNAIDEVFADEFESVCAELDRQQLRVGVLDAEGPAFCAGADLGDLEASARAVDRVLDILGHAPIYWTAVVDGAVRGAGVALLCLCPRVVATPTSTFGLPELAKGFFPGDLMPSQVVALGLRNAFGLAFSAKPLSAAEAHRQGWVSAVVEADGLYPEAEAEAARLASYRQEAVLDGVRLWQRFVRNNS